MELIICGAGNIRAVYDEAIDLSVLGELSIRRGSHVEPLPAREASNGLWGVDLTPVNGPKLGPFPTRSAALQVEVQWLREHWLSAPVS